MSNSIASPFWIPPTAKPLPGAPMALTPRGSLWNTKAAPSAPPSLVPRLTSKATVKFWRTSMRPVDIAVPAWSPAVVRVKTLFATLALPCGVSVTAPGGGADRHGDSRGSGRRSVGDRVGKAVSTAEARGGGISDRVVAVDRCGAVHEVRHGGNGEGIVVGIAVIGQHGNVDRSARRRRRRIVNRDGGAIAGRLAFEGGGDADVAHALRVAQPACAGAEAEIGEVRAAEELRSDVAGERRSPCGWPSKV